MPAEKISVYNRVPRRFELSVKTPKKEKKYLGLEKRMETRRQSMDRRVNVRFNLSKPDRRVQQGRREDDVLPEFF